MSKLSAIQNLQNEATRLLETAKLIEELLPDNLPELAEVWGTDRNIRLHVPFNWQVYRQTRRALGPDWKRFNAFTDKDGDLYVDLKHTSGAYLVITLRSEVAGATCHREQIGVKEVPVYKVICH